MGQIKIFISEKTLSSEEFIHPLNHSFNRYLVTACSVPSIRLGIGDIAVNKRDKNKILALVNILGCVYVCERGRREAKLVFTINT